MTDPNTVTVKLKRPSTLYAQADGEGAGRFMSALKRFIEQPLELLLRLR